MSAIADFRATLARKMQEEYRLNRSFYPASITEEERQELRRDIGHTILLATEFLTHDELLSILRHREIQMDYRDACFYKGLFLNHARHSLKERDEQ